MSYLILKIKLVFLLCLLHLYPVVLADEGIWIPSLLEHYKMDIMHEKGLRLSASDIYNINQASLTDGVVIFGRGCTGSVISGDGLVLSNHHCAYSTLQSLSTLEQDYLSMGYWAASREEEIPAPGLSVTFLQRIEDVTEKVLEGTGHQVTEADRSSIVSGNIRRITEDAVNDTHYSAVIRPFYYGNEYYMFIYEQFNDIRLVGTPPNFIGSFGADPDNWMWPRHSGDFILFRIYADQHNMPAFYSSGNIPYKPRKVIPVSARGYEAGDFTMILGYPGTTERFLISPALEMIHSGSLTRKIKLRDKRLEIMDKHMKASDEVSFKYLPKYRSVSNAWKKWQGVLHGLNRVDGVNIKRQQERDFSEWLASDAERFERLGNLLPEMFSLYDELSQYNLVFEYAQECILATELFSYFIRVGGLTNVSGERTDEQMIISKERFFNELRSFFENYHQPIDLEIFAAMMQYYYEDIHEQFHPDFFSDIHGKYKGDYGRFARDVFRKSSLTTYEDYVSLFSDYPENLSRIRSRVINDPLYRVFSAFSRIYGQEVYARYEFINGELNHYYRKYITALMEMYPDSTFYPDANFTMRLTYGEVSGYQPRDAVSYHYQTTVDGIIEKSRTGIIDYEVSDRFLELVENKDFGEWADADGNMYVCFIASNHTSGGNSGSPVMNREGQMIGINFDRNWEGTMNDYIYDPDQCRNISVDIRYVLFIIDKYAGAGHLIEEMNVLY